MKYAFGAVLLILLPTPQINAQEQPISFYSEIPTSAPFEAYFASLQASLADAGFVIEEGREPISVGRGGVLELISQFEGAIGFMFLQDTILDGDGAAALLTVPAAFTSFERRRQAQQGFVGDIARSEITQDGVLALGLWTHGINTMVTRSSIVETSGFEGLRVQTNDLISQVFFQQLGAAPLGLPFAEVFSALQLGVFDTAVWPQEFVRSEVLSIIEGGMVLTDHSSRVAVTLVSDAWWSTLGAGEQRRILSALNQAEAQAAGVIDDQAEALAAALEEFSITDASWSDFSGETLDAAIISTAAEVSSTAAEVVVQLYNDALAFWDELDFVAPSEEREGNSQQTRSQVFFATDRRYDHQFDMLVDRFANESGTPGVWYCGELTPATPFKLGEFLGVVQLSDGRTISEAEDCISEIIDAASARGGRVLIYVHGYRNDFLDATRTGLAFARDLALESPLVVWSWPSAGRLRSYARDSDAVDWSQFQFSRFVNALASSPEIAGVDIMAHSMGTRLAANLMRDSWPGGDAAVVLAAADIARPNLRQATDQADGAHVTLLVSRRDIALLASEFLGTREPRAGRLPPIFAHLGVDTIDLSAFDRIAVNHAHAFEVGEVVNDLARLFAGEWRADARGLERRQNFSIGVDHYVILSESN